MSLMFANISPETLFFIIKKPLGFFILLAILARKVLEATPIEPVIHSPSSLAMSFLILWAIL